MRFLFFKTGRQRGAVFVVIAAAGAVSGIAIAANSGDSTQQRLAQSGAATSPAATPANEASAFGVLRSGNRTVPAAVAQAFAHAPQYDGAFAPNPSLARPLAQSNPYTGSEAWIVPADDGLCLYVPDTEGAATTCNTLEEVKEGDLHLVLAPFGKPSFVVGVVPDGVASVEVTNADGSTQKLVVTDNSYAIRSADVRTITIGSTVVKVPQAAKTVPAVPSSAG